MLEHGRESIKRLNAGKNNKSSFTGQWKFKTFGLVNRFQGGRERIKRLTAMKNNKSSLLGQWKVQIC